jgi:hypothetical protein
VKSAEEDEEEEILELEKQARGLDNFGELFRNVKVVMNFIAHHDPSVERSLKIVREMNQTQAPCTHMFKDRKTKKKQLPTTMFFQTATLSGPAATSPLLPDSLSMTYQRVSMISLYFGKFIMLYITEHIIKIFVHNLYCTLVFCIFIVSFYCFYIFSTLLCNLTKKQTQVLAGRVHSTCTTAATMTTRVFLAVRRGPRNLIPANIKFDCIRILLVLTST